MEFLKKIDKVWGNWETQKYLHIFFNFGLYLKMETHFLKTF